VQGAEPPAPTLLDEFSSLAEERVGARAVAGGPPGVCERREDARLVPQGRAPLARARQRPLEQTARRGDGPRRERRCAEAGRVLPPGARAAALYREADRATPVGGRGGKIPSQAPDLAQEGVRAVDDLDRGIVLVREERGQSRLGLGGPSEVGARQRPPHAT